MTEDRSPKAWCILKTAPSRTLALAAALTDAGFSAWTPAAEETRRVSRSRNRKTITVPVIAGIVFGPYDRVRELHELSRSPSQTYLVWDASQRRMVMRGCPYFTVFRHLDRFPWIADNELDPLRLSEQRGKQKTKAAAFKTGDLVKHPQNGFEGLVGTVCGSKGRFALVAFPGLSIPVHIEPRQLIPA